MIGSCNLLLIISDISDYDNLLNQALGDMSELNRHGDPPLF
jgi:hypothetical protein